MVLRYNCQDNGSTAGKFEGLASRLEKNVKKTIFCEIGFGIADKIETNKDFEVYVEYNDAVSFTVWLRELDKKDSKM